MSGGSIYIINSNIVGCAVSSSGGAVATGDGVTLTTVAGNMTLDENLHTVPGNIAISDVHNIFGSNVAGIISGDSENVVAGAIFASIDPSTVGGQIDADGVVPLRSSTDNPALSAVDPIAALPFDQLGHSRPQPTGTLNDLGAVELNRALYHPSDRPQRSSCRHRRR